MNRNVEQMLQVTTEIGSKTQRQTHTLSEMGEGMRSIYLLSLLETYTEMQEQLSSILMIEEPELFLHPTLQRVLVRFCIVCHEKIRLCLQLIHLIFLQTLTAAKFDR